MANIVQKDNKAYRVWDKTNNEWNELNLKTNTNSVFDNSGTKLATKIDAINGISSDPSAEADDIAASTKLVKQLNDSLGVDIKLIDGVPNWSERGADTWSPFKENKETIVNNIKSQTFSVNHNTGGSSGLFSYTYTVDTGLDNILYAFCAVSTSKATNCSANVTNISDDGIITFVLTMDGDIWYSTGSTKVFVVYYED